VKLEHTKYTKTLPAYTDSYTFLQFTHGKLRTNDCYWSPPGFFNTQLHNFGTFKSNVTIKI